MSDPNSNVGESDDVWGNASPSAFTTSNVVDANDVYAESAEAMAQTDFTEAQPTRAGAAKPNIAILAVAGLVGMAALGGFGFIVKQKLFPAERTEQQRSLVNEVSKSSQKPGSVFDAPLVGAAPASVLEPTTTPTQALAAIQTVAVTLPESAPASVIATPVAATASAPGAAKVAQPLASTVPTASSSLAAAVAAAPSAGPTAASAAPVMKEKEKVKHVAAPAAVATAGESPALAKAVPAKKSVADSKPADSKTSETKPKAEKKSVVATRQPSKTREPVVRSRSAKPKSTRFAKQTKEVQTSSAKAGSGSETIVLQGGLKVQSIYPQSGPNAQAWVKDSSGRTEIVRVGDFLRGGAMVTAIIGEKGHVVTAAGLITTQGVRQ